MNNVFWSSFWKGFVDTISFANIKYNYQMTNIDNYWLNITDDFVATYRKMVKKYERS